MSAPNPHKDEIVRLRKAKIGPAEIARRLNLTSGQVAGILHRAGLTVATGPFKRYTAAQRRAALKDLERMSSYRVAAKHGMGPSTLRRWAQESAR